MDKNFSHSGFFILLVGAIFSTQALAAELSGAQIEILGKHLDEVGRGCSINLETVKSQAPAGHGGAIGFVALYTAEDPEYTGGNNYEQKLSVFATKESGYRLLDSKRVGGKLYRDVELAGAPDDEIYLDVMFYSDEDAACCPSIQGTTSYYLNKHNQLEEKSTRVTVK